MLGSSFVRCGVRVGNKLRSVWPVQVAAPRRERQAGKATVVLNLVRGNGLALQLVLGLLDFYLDTIASRVLSSAAWVAAVGVWFCISEC